MAAERAWLTSAWRSDPVFHRWVRALGLCGDWSACGHSLMGPTVICLPREHAEKFARPCKICYPS